MTFYTLVKPFLIPHVKDLDLFEPVYESLSILFLRPFSVFHCGNLYFSYCTIFMLHFFHTAPLPCYTFLCNLFIYFTISCCTSTCCCFRFPFFFCCTLCMLQFFPVALCSCCTISRGVAKAATNI